MLRELGSDQALVVHGSDGLDEITLTGPTQVSELKDGQVSTRQIHPGDFGLQTVPAEALKGGDADHNARILRGVLDGEEGPQRDVVLLNAAAAMVVGGRAEDITAGLEVARESIDSGKARPSPGSAGRGKQLLIMADILSEIAAYKREFVADRQRERSLADVRSHARDTPDTGRFPRVR